MAGKSIMGGHNMGSTKTGQQGGRTAPKAMPPKPAPSPSPMPAAPPMQITPTRTIKGSC